MTDEAARSDTRVLAGLRLAVGLAQGLALYLLYSAYDSRVWPASDGAVFAPFVMLSLFLPLLVIQSVGNIRWPALGVWTATVAIVIAGLAWYDIWRDWPWDTAWFDGKQQIVPHVLPSFGVMFFSAAGLFIAHALTTGGDAERRFIASYPTHFDVAWKFGVQLALSAAFVGAFWLLLWLGSELFKLIKLDFLERLIDHRWFAIPVTTLAIAAALHVTDVRAGLVRGARTLALVLLSWLLPLMALFAAGFLVSLLFTGLEPLWATRSAAALLLTAAAVLVILINATYQDGESDRYTPPLVLKIATRVSAVVLIPIVSLAAYAIFLRVRQYGWTDDRVASAAVTLVAAGYAIGYATAAVFPGGWMKRIERWNFAMALGVLAVLLALFTPIADPARIAVASQVARLEDGAVPVDRFDFSFLRLHGERFGFEALTRLRREARGASAARIKRISSDLLSKQTITAPSRVSPGEILANVTVYPKGQSLPEGLVSQHWEWGPLVPSCLLYRQTACDAFIRDLDGDGRSEIIFATGSGDFLGTAEVLALDGSGRWVPVGGLAEPRCQGALKAMHAGKFSQIAKLPRFRNIDAAGVTLRFTPAEPRPDTPCPVK